MSHTDRPDAWRPADRPLRLARSLAAALACVTAAAVGHVSAGGTMPAVTVVSAFVGSAAVAWLLSARRVTSSQLLGLLVLCQVVVHLGASAHEMTMGPGMVGAHLAATAASVLVLSRGEAFVWQLAERLALRVTPLLRVVLVPPTRPRPVAVVALRARHDVRLAHSLWLRGPPVSLV
ncbi:hypothetical protein [Aeromicrobium fastidiosum]|uniref:Uncharacterized protein n=1 Tax=Aeromicrobium fastidiosum TaxID=52699 RepID=A0A641AN49_9ACTN|nr:hypothetical protein [Aeromicrobium fastidiosum]KAA1376222.1 hypothetical protein ESP62_012340 [Aeromicrobium fastidiosum]MBP2391889.1 hypothetical protein [Aeromicrobium fastidiosum]